MKNGTRTRVKGPANAELIELAISLFLPYASLRAAKTKGMKATALCVVNRLVPMAAFCALPFFPTAVTASAECHRRGGRDASNNNSNKKNSTRARYLTHCFFHHALSRAPLRHHHLPRHCCRLAPKDRLRYLPFSVDSESCKDGAYRDRKRARPTRSRRQRLCSRGSAHFDLIPLCPRTASFSGTEIYFNSSACVQRVPPCSIGHSLRSS